MAGNQDGSAGLRGYLVVLRLVLVLAATGVGAAALGALRGETPMLLAGVVAALGWLGWAAWGLIEVGRAWPVSGAGPQARLLAATRVWLLVLVWWAPAAGLVLAFVSFIDCGPIWIPNLLHWSGLGFAAVGLAALYTLPAVASAFSGAPQEAAPSRPWWRIVVHCAGLALVWGLVWLIPYLALLRDDVDPADYAGAPSGFLLPWPGEQDGWVIQGNNAGLNHNADHNSQDFAWDFRRECGTPVLAARAGEVSEVEDTNDGLGGDNNRIDVTHDDGSVASYLHIRRGSAVVAEGDGVSQGDPLARVGCVGNSLTGHLHFHVRSGGATIPVSFDDVDGGVPRSFGSYTSGNRR